MSQVFEVIADDKGIVTDMPAWYESASHEFLGIHVQECLRLTTFKLIAFGQAAHKNILGG